MPSLPFSRNPFFTGREEQLTAIHTALSTRGRAALSGLGGMGKTQTALEYAYRHCSDYTHVFWVKAEQESELIADYVALAKSLHIPGHQQDDPQMVASLVKQWLATHDGWLLIFDNADDLRQLRPYLPATGGHILMTTRAQALGDLAQKVEINRMEPDEGALLLLRRAKVIAEDAEIAGASEADQALAHNLNAEMDGLPLALDQAGAFIEEQHLSLEEYLDLFKSEKAELLGERGQLDPDHPSVTVTFSLAFAKVADSNAAAADLIRACAFLAPDAIPEEIFTEGAETIGEALQAAAKSKLAWTKAIGEATRFSLIDRNPQAKTLSIHRLVQTVIREEMDEENQRQWVEGLVDAVLEVFPDAEYENWAQCDRILLHAQAIHPFIAEHDLATEAVALLFSRTAYYLEQQGRYSDAEPLFIQALDMYRQLLGSDHPYVATSLNNLAGLYESQGRYSDAEPLYIQALDMRRQLLGSDHPDVATSLNNLAALYKAQGRYSDAEPLFIQALDMWRQLLGSDHPDVASSLNNLAALYKAQGRYSDAEPLYIQALDMRRQLLGSDHPDVATSLNNLAALYNAQGRYSDAEPLYIQALEIAYQRMGEDHPNTQVIWNNFAGCIREAFQAEQADQLSANPKTQAILQELREQATP